MPQLSPLIWVVYPFMMVVLVVFLGPLLWDVKDSVGEVEWLSHEKGSKEW